MAPFLFLAYRFIKFSYIFVILKAKLQTQL
jgi:hypothetical protein